MNQAELQEALLDRARQAGFSEAEVYVSAGRSLEVRIFEGEIAHYENSRQIGVCFRGLADGKMGYAFSEKLDEDAIAFLLEEAASNAAVLADNEKEDLFAGEAIEPAPTFDSELARIEPAAVIEAARQIEKGALAADTRIRGVEYALAEYSEGEHAIANTLGLNVRQRSNLLVAFGMARAEDAGSIKHGTEIWQGRRLSGLDGQAIGRTAAGLALAQLGARPVASGTYRILLDRQAAVDLWKTFLPIFFADKIQQGFSLLGDRLGQMIAAPVLSLTDRPRCPASFYWPAFDSEGAATRDTGLIQAGRLCAVLHNRKTAAKAGTATTGNGFKPSYRAPVQVATTNCVLEPGPASPEDLLHGLDHGLLVTGLSGLHSGTNLVSGDFSLLAEGFAIENGRRIHPVEQITVAGNFYQLLQSVEAVGSDLWFGLPGGSGQVGSPSLLLSGLAVSGR